MLFPPEFVFFFGWGAPARGTGTKGRGNISTMREPPYRMQKLPSEDSFRRQFFLLSQIYARSVEGWLPRRRRVRGEAQLYLLGGGLILRQRRQLVQAEIAGGQRLAVRAKLPAQQLALDEKLDDPVGVARAVMPVPVLRRDDAPRADEPPYCARPDPYEDDPYEDRDPYVPEPYEEPP